jgi:predicted acetyltransferase
VPVSIRDAKHSAADRTWIRAQYPEYLEDLSQLNKNTGVFPVSGEFGEREAELMARWFADDSSHPLVILKDGKLVGFALVTRPLRNQRTIIDYRMADFFISLKSRRLGVGRNAARLIFNRFAGMWEVTELLFNKSAVSFWRATIADYTQGKFNESVVDSEVKQVFRSSTASLAR